MRWIIFFLLVLIGEGLLAQLKPHQRPGVLNPLLPGYFADPTVRKFGDVYYIYATTDGNGGGFGPSQVWTSRDFVNWSMQDMNWPTTHHYWAPDVTKAKDGKYYMYYCQPVEIFGASASSPVGPWLPLLPAGQPLVKNFLVPNVITLDGQTFLDDNGKIYLFWGTWGIYPNHGCGIGLFNADMKSFARLDKIPNTIAKDFFEAPFMFKRNGIYYLTYSSGRCEDDTYKVQYATSKTGPMGPFEYGKNNPILSTSADGSVHGPGHQSVLENNKDFYLIYHRHNNPHSGGGYHRQIAADKLVFDKEGNIEKMQPTHSGVGFLGKNSNPYPDLMYRTKVTASSFYNDDFKAEFAVDNNNGTLWKPKDNNSASWLIVDLGLVQQVKSVHTQFEYATWYYQYLIESSLDEKKWEVFADQRKNTTHGSPMIDIGNVKARYLRITIFSTEYPGLNKAIWNFKAFANDNYHPKMAVQVKQPSALKSLKPLGLLVDLDAYALEIGTAVKHWQSNGMLGGQFLAEGSMSPSVEMLDGRKAVLFPGKVSMTSDIKAPESMLGNSSFTVSTWVYNASVEDEEPIVSWTARGGVDITNASIGYGSNKRFGAVAHWGWPDMAYQSLPDAGKWHHIAVVFDGTNEKLYVDGVLDHQELKMLFIANLKNFMLGTNADKSGFLSGAISSLKIYDVALTEGEVVALSKEVGKSDVTVYLDAGKLDYGALKDWKNEGYLGGSLVDGFSVEDFSGKIALKLKGKDQEVIGGRLAKLAKESLGSDYSMVSVLAGKAFGDIKWHHVARVFDNGAQHVYIDGVLDGSRRLDGLFDAGSNAQIDALSSVVMYKKVLSKDEVAALYCNWKLSIPLSRLTASFKSQPDALSPKMVSMTAGALTLPGSVLQYLFTATDDQGGERSSGWINEPDFIDFDVSANRSYHYSLKVRDNYGNVSWVAKSQSVSTARSLFRISTDDFEETRDYHVDLSNSVWDGVDGKADQMKAEKGIVTLASTATSWDGNENRGPFLYKIINGDFIAQVEVTDVIGLREKKTDGPNDVGLMVSAAEGFSDLIQNSVFLAWGVGNIVTSLNRNGRFQWNNASAWNFYKHLQIQRSGNKFYLRAGDDGKSWQELPGSPIVRPEWENKMLKIGLYQATYGNQYGYGSFRNFETYQRK